MSAQGKVARLDVDRRVRFESLLANLSSRFVKLPPDDIDGEIDRALAEICEFLGIDIGTLNQLPSSSCTDELVISHLYRPLGGPPLPADGLRLQLYCPWAMRRALEGEITSLRSMENAPPEAARDVETWKHFGIKTVLVFPLSAGGGPVFGALGLHATREERPWHEEIIRRLGLVAEVFANALDRKQSELALRESEQRLSLAAEAAEIGMWSLAVDKERFWASDRGREIFGYDHEAPITTKGFLKSVCSEHRERVTKALRSAAEVGRAIDVEYEIEHSNGRRRWVHSFGKVLDPGAEQGSTQILGATVDVTDRHESEEALRRSCAEIDALRRQLELENTFLRREVRRRDGGGRVVAASPAIKQVMALAEQVAPTDTTVLVEGETGVGKEVIARHIHERSGRRDRPMVKVNCAALPSTLVESELFGREKGAYTGAVSREPGRFEVANGSTILLDEIAELPLELQSKLLRVLEEGQFERVGSARVLNTDVRVIAATNRDLRVEVEAGRFRRDLFYRLEVFPIRVPPLRERREDLEPLVWSFVEELGAAMNRTVESIHRQDLERLEHCHWPGNVRELRNLVERSLILCREPVLRIVPPTTKVTRSDTGILSLDEVQRRQIRKALAAARGRLAGAGGAADLLNLKPTTLRSRMQRLGLDPTELRNEPAAPEEHDGE